MNEIDNLFKFWTILMLRFKDKGYVLVKSE